MHAGQRVGRAALDLALLGDEQEERRVSRGERHELLATRHLDRLLAAHGARRQRQLVEPHARHLGVGREAQQFLVRVGMDQLQRAIARLDVNGVGGRCRGARLRDEQAVFGRSEPDLGTRAAQHGDRLGRGALALHRCGRDRRALAAEHGTARARQRHRLLQLGHDDLLEGGMRVEDATDLVDAVALLLALLFELEAVEARQALDRHVDDPLGLVVIDRHGLRLAMRRDLELRDQLGLGIVVIVGAAHDLDDGVDRVERGEQRDQAVQLAQELVALVLEAIGDDREAEVDEAVERLAQADLARRAFNEDGHVDAYGHAQRGGSEKIGDQAVERAAALAADLHAGARAIRQVLRHLGDVADLLGARGLDDLGHDLVGRDAVGELGDDERLYAAR